MSSSRRRRQARSSGKSSPKQHPPLPLICCSNALCLWLYLLRFVNVSRVNVWLYLSRFERLIPQLSHQELQASPHDTCAVQWAEMQLRKQCAPIHHHAHQHLLVVVDHGHILDSWEGVATLLPDTGIHALEGLNRCGWQLQQQLDVGGLCPLQEPLVKLSAQLHPVVLPRHQV